MTTTTLLPVRRRRPTHRLAATCAAAVLGLGALAGCSDDGDGNDDGGDGESADPVLVIEDLEERVSTGLTETVGQAPEDVDCPDDLAAEADAETRCTVTADGQTYGATVTVTSVDGADAQLDIQVDEQPTEPAE
ncbi:hypothetical protein GCM10023340_18340 [Nocardioides marinquilinus]|uniref:DUF4333 domain-containing protein n=1 Tax=Nocardioides marinquilinus TaxID=1210400 RepID=A0ABP9PHY8_9ACTN